MRAARPELLLLIWGFLLPACGGRALPGVLDGGASPMGEVWLPPDAGAPDDTASRPAPDLYSFPDLSWGPDPFAQCTAGQRMWCDSLVYDGWGWVECDPATGRWKTQVANGKTVLDCHASPGGERPNTVCACYHFFTNFSCCERPDCILEPGQSGQVCPPSPGQLCNYCNPLQPECVETDAKCVTTNAHESFCARLCSAAAPCPTGYACMTVKLKQGSTQQCVPSDFSCLY
jgi:hypothetical protein